MSKLKRARYEELLKPLAAELVNMAHWVSATGQRVAIIFEGRDTAGKGGAIDAIRGKVNPRQCRVVALGKPTDAEKGQWYFQRYVPHLPGKGEIVLFDRSWYNRAGVERVMGYATPTQIGQFLEQAPVFEKLLVDDGVLLFKYWLAVDQEKQEERFAERVDDPLKRWKLSPVDLLARTKYAEYGRARDAMFEKTHTSYAPWTVVDFNDQKTGRLNLIRDLLDRLPDFKVPARKIDFPKLKGKPGKEHYTGPVKPIKGKF